MKILLHKAFIDSKLHDKEYQNFDKFFEVASSRDPAQQRPYYNFGKLDMVNRYLKIEFHNWLMEMNTTYKIVTGVGKNCTEWYVDIEDTSVAILFKLTFMGEI